MTVPNPSSATPEPVALAEVVRSVLIAVVAIGWLTLDNATVNAVASVIGLALSWVLTWVARSKVTPVPPAPPVIGGQQ